MQSQSLGLQGKVGAISEGSKADVVPQVIRFVGHLMQQDIKLTVLKTLQVTQHDHT